MSSIDLNCDMGESFGSYTMGNDAAIMKWVSSVNIACGFHAGDASVMKETVDCAIESNVCIGAHPSFPDLQGFGRREMQLSPKEVYDIVLYQVGSLYGFVKAAKGKLSHVKPHGALYNVAAKNRKIADAIVDAVINFDSTLILFGLSGSELIQAAKSKGLICFNEAFADRTYQPDGSLTPRSRPNSTINNANEVTNQVMTMVKEKRVKAVDGTLIPIEADTICIHGDGPHALEFAKAIHHALTEQDIKIGAPQNVER